MSSAQALALLERAQEGDHQAFERLVEPHLPQLRRLAQRMIGHPQDAEDVLQDSLLKALGAMAKFKAQSKFSTWMHQIVSRTALDYLRGRGLWRWNAQEMVRLECHDNQDKLNEVLSILRAPEFEFDIREHIAFCFTCVSRSLSPELQIVLILKDVLDYKNDEAAQIVGLTTSVFRHRLAEARKEMKTRFDGLCAVVNKEGLCRQCEGLRGVSREDGQGEGMGELLGTDGQTPEKRYQHRLRVVQQSEFHQGRSASLHDYLFERISKLEAFAQVGKEPLS